MSGATKRARIGSTATRRARVVAVVLLALLSFSAATAEEPQKLSLASDVWPPFTNISGQHRFAVQLVHEALARLGIETETEIVEWKRAIAGMREGSFDGSAAIWHSSERDDYLLFSRPYLQNRLVLVGRKGSDVSASSFAELRGKRIAVVERYAYGDDLGGAADITLVEGSSDQVSLEKLLRGEVDYMLVDQLLIRYLLEYQQEEATTYLEIGTKPLIRQGLHFAVRRDLAGAEAIVEGFNTQIRNMQADGTYNEILQLNWIRADVDGDGRLELVSKGALASEVAPLTSYHIVMPESEGEPIQITDRFYVGGQVYDGWDTIPDRYRVATGLTVEDKPTTPVVLFRFKF